MEFKLDEFTTNPSVDKLERCKKADFLTLAAFFEVQIGVLPKSAAATGGVDEQKEEPGVDDQKEVSAASLPVPAFSPPMDPLICTGMTAAELQLVLHIKEAEMRNKELEVKTMHLQLRALELEQKQSPVSTPSVNHPIAPSSPPQDSFDVSRHVALVPQFRET
ncbi:hypothetical protein LDENG_00020280 [Lucifuga dentata]|nr:hypothetical protein LDENG_00020280 [Lucifuga dentata]